MKGLGALLTQTGNIAAHFGNAQLGGMIANVGAATVGFRQMTAELGKSKLALAAIGTAGFAGGLSMAESIGQIFDPAIRGRGERDITKRYLELLDQIQLRLLAIKDAGNGAQQAAQNAIRSQIAGVVGQGAVSDMFGGQSELLGAVSGFSPEQVAVLTDNLLRLGEATQQAFDAAKVRDYQTVMGELNDQLRTFGNESGQQLLLLTQQMDAYVAKLADNAATDVQYWAGVEQVFELFEKRKTEIMARESETRKMMLENERKTQLRTVAQNLEAYGALLGGLGNLAAVFGKKTFGLTKGLRISEAIVNTAAAVTNALATPAPWPVPLIFAAAAAAAGAAQIAVIGASKYQGQAHDGLDYVPRTGSYVLEKGEAVIKRDQNERLDALMGVGQPTVLQLVVDGRVLGEIVGNLSRGGQLKIHPKAVRA